MTRFVYVATTVQFNCEPDRAGNGQTVTRQQVQGRYSDGSLVVYDKSDCQRGEYRLSFSCLSGAVVNELLTFLDLVDGRRYAFTWIDPLGDERIVKFKDSSINYVEIGPDRYSVAFSLIERELL